MNEEYSMSDGLTSVLSDDVSATAVSSAGSLIRAAREAQGLHIAALAVSLKVPVKKLEALEADRLDLLPDVVFVRALASSVCRALKVDATDILAKLPQTSAPRLEHAQQSINTPFRMPTDDSAASAALAGLKSSAALETPNPDSTASGTAMGAGSVLTSDGGVRPASAGTGDTQATLALSSNVSVANSSPSVASPTMAMTAGGTAVADGMVVFRATGESWVEVIDATGKVTLRRLLLAGEAVGANGALPLRVTVGRADQTTVLVRGKPFDGESLVRDNVLRFEVK
jgi:cytoskeleton protein RodZ